MEIPKPQIVQSITKYTWQYSMPSALATGGIYTQQDLDKLRDHIIFPAEKKVVLNTLARGISSHETVSGSISLMGILDE